MSIPVIAPELLPLKVGRSLVGKTVYTYREGKKAGIVKEVFFDESFSKLHGFDLGREGFFSRSHQLITVENIKVIGEDIIIIDSMEVIEKADKQALAQLLPLSAVKGKEVVDRGIKLAIAGDVAVSGQTEIVGITFSKILVEGKLRDIEILDKSAISEIGADEAEAIHVDLDKF